MRVAESVDDRALDVERVVCALADLEPGAARGFTVGGGDWPVRGVVVREGKCVRGYLNRCPHAGHPLNLLPHRFLTPDGTLLLCSSHGAVFEKSTGLCLAGPCSGQMLTPIALEVVGNFVLLAADLDLRALAALAEAAP
jgi:nitrite reductase/ring-hydroxylating ferredoxin subunit